MVIKSVDDLQIYKASLEILPKLYRLLDKIPIFERDSIIQIKKAAKSIPPVIAEGFAKRNSTKEFKRYLLIAIGSSDEVITHLKVVIIVIPSLKLDAEDLINDYNIISRRLNSLHKNWNINKLYRN